MRGRFRVAIMAAVLVGAVVSPVTASARGHTVDVCHATANGSFHLINISENAVGKHLGNHGDGLPGDPVPGMLGYTFDDDCVPVADAKGVVLDDYNTGAFTLTPPPPTVATSVLASVPSGTRYLFLADGLPTGPDTMMSLVAGNNYLDIAVGTSPGNYRISYGGNTVTVVTPLNLDLTANGADRLQLVLSQAGTTGAARIILASGCAPGGVGGCAAFLNSDLPVSGPATYDFLFSNFPTVDLTDVDHLEIQFDGGLAASTTMRLEELRTNG